MSKARLHRHRRQHARMRNAIVLLVIVCALLLARSVNMQRTLRMQEQVNKQFASQISGALQIATDALHVAKGQPITKPLPKGKHQ